MRIHHEFLIEACCAQDVVRPILTHVMVQRMPSPLPGYDSGDVPYNGVAVAANGFFMAVVPVELDASDIEGPVPQEYFRLARRAADRKQDAEMYLGRWRVAFPALGADYPRPDPAGMSFPKWERLIPERWPTPYPLISRTFGFNLNYLTMINRACGNRRDGNVIITRQENHHGAVFIEYRDPKMGDPLIPPYGILMPIAGDLTETEHQRFKAGLDDHDQQLEIVPHHRAATLEASTFEPLDWRK